MTKPRRPQHWVIDSIEEKSARIELPDGSMITIPRAILPAGAKEGQVLSVTVEIDEEETVRAVARSTKQTAAISRASRKHDKGGDVVL